MLIWRLKTINPNSYYWLCPLVKISSGFGPLDEHDNHNPQEGEGLSHILGTLMSACISVSLSIGGKIDSSKVDAVLGNMGMDLTEKELKDVTQNLPVDGEHFGYHWTLWKNYFYEPIYNNH